MEEDIPKIYYFIQNNQEICGGCMFNVQYKDAIGFICVRHKVLVDTDTECKLWVDKDHIPYFE